MNFAQKVILFNSNLDFTGKLPAGIRIMNPFRANREVISLVEAFYNRFYSDQRKRRLILGINPGRLGAGSTGIPFTDTKRLSEICHISATSISTHEPSSVFIYQLIDRYGGPSRFYRDFYINSVCPLGFLRRNEKKNWVNYNYYDDPRLFSTMKPFILASLGKQLDFGIDTDICYVLGSKNARFFTMINKEEKIFRSVITLDHPRYIEQYRSKKRESYLAAYLNQLVATDINK